MLLLAFTGLAPPARVLDAVRRGDAAGVALYASLNIESPAQLRALGEAVQRAAREGGQPRAIVGIDQEGGQLMAVGPPATMFAGNLALAATRDADLARRVGQAIGRELAAVGCNVNWAPDCDLATTPPSPAVGGRAFGDEPLLAAELARAFTEGLQSAGVAATAKHFPGAGETATDPHDGLPVVGVDAAVLERRELAPFRGAIAAGARLVMVTHAAYPGLEPDGSWARSAMRSPAILGELLRRRLAFDGVVVTDALDMGAIDQADVPAAALAAVEAGVDLLLLGPAQASRADELATLRRGLASRSGMTATASPRVGALRAWLADGQAPELIVVGCGEHAALAAELAQRSITLVRDTGSLLPLRPGADARLVAVTPRPADLTPADTSSRVSVGLAGAVRRRHPRTEAVEVPIDPDDGAIQRALAQAAGAEAVIVGTINAFGHPGQRALVRALVGAGARVVVVALRLPTDADALPEAGTIICSYSIHDPSVEAAVAVLFGELAAPGRLPIGGGGS